MSHSHDHHHGNDHHDHCHQQVASAMSVSEKLRKLLDHWIRHNDDHAANYRDWAARARAEGLDETAALLEQAAELTQATSEKFAAAARHIV